MASDGDFFAAADWYRNAETGEAAIRIVEKGREYMRLHRTQQVITVPYRATEWIPDVERKPFTDVVVARAAHAADMEVCRGLGLFKLGQQSWDSLSEEQKASRIQRKPLPAPQIRADLQAKIWEVLGEFTRS